MTRMTRLQPGRRWAAKREIPPLENGDHLDQKTFHERYAAMPEHVRAELIGGVVFMSPPQKKPHGRSQLKLLRWLDECEEATPGTEAIVNTTNILGPESEPQPDGALLILPECGGQTWLDEEHYIHGAPELLTEVAFATESIDLNAKKLDYERAGVREYVVAALRMNRVFWFVRQRGKFKEIQPDADGVFRSRIFPGLWLDAGALLRRDNKRVLAVLRQGLASPEHAAFVAKLQAKRKNA
jgi:Putative restriction endonuclease